MTNIEFVTTLHVEGQPAKSYTNLVGIPALPIIAGCESYFEVEVTNAVENETFTLTEVDGKDGKTNDEQKEKVEPTVTVEDLGKNKWRVRSTIMENYKFKVESSIADSRNPLVLDLDYVVEDTDTGFMISPGLLRDRARTDFEQYAGKLRTVGGYFKIVKNDKIVGVAQLNMLSSYPFTQIPKDFVNNYKEDDVTIDKDLLKDYKFEHTYIFKQDNQVYPAYGEEIDRLIEEDKKKLGTDRLVYCFSVRDKISSSTRSFFYDNVTKNLICIQGLDLLLSDEVKVTTAVESDKVNVMKIDAYYMGYKNSVTTPDTSIAAYIPNEGDATVIEANITVPASELKDLLVNNNNDLKACIVALPSSSMQTGRDATYPQAITTVGTTNVLKANTPTTLFINLGNQSALTKDKTEDNIPNCIIAQNAVMNNFYLRSNYSSCNDKSNFGIFLPLY